MKTHKTRNAVLALTALGALSAYILACTAFSPDDTKVLYPAFDTSSGAVGMAVYDRETRRSEMLFLPVVYDGGSSNATAAPQLMRADWLANGRNILIACAGGEGGDNDTLTLALVPWVARAPVKLFRLQNLKDVGSVLRLPLCVSGEYLLLQASQNEVLRLNLKTGVLTSHEFAGDSANPSLFPAPSGAGVFYVEDRAASPAVIFGRLNPDDFTRTPLATLTNEVPEESVFLYDRNGKRLGFLAGGAEPRLTVVEPGKPPFVRTIGVQGEKWEFGSGGFSVKGDTVWASFQKQAAGTNLVSYGLLEIPVSQAPVRETILIPPTHPGDEAGVFYFQASVSHDGKTAAVASTYLALTTKEFKPKDCALFLVDLSRAARRVTKIPIPMPAFLPGVGE